METKDIIFIIAVYSCCALVIVLLYWYNKPPRMEDIKPFKPKYDIAGAERLQAKIFGNVKDDEKPKEEPIKKSLWDRILEAIGL
ncbi:MAG: hypothetical protein WBW71_16435 [Bacteroidota bacterium]